MYMFTDYHVILQYSCIFYNQQAGLVSSFQQLEITLERVLQLFRSHMLSDLGTCCGCIKTGLALYFELG